MWRTKVPVGQVRLISLSHKDRYQLPGFNHKRSKLYFEIYLMFSSSLEQSSHTVSSSFEVNNLPHDAHFIV